jgi:AcrR family transcriptional regulator
MIAEKSGEPLTFSRLADEAQVSRRTLYTHWGTIERVIGEAVTLAPLGAEVDTEGKGPREILRALLRRKRDRLTDPVTHLALTSLVAQASADDKAAEVLASMSLDRLGEYSELLVPMTHNQYSQIVGPLYFKSLVLSEPIDDEVIDMQVELGLRILGLS